MAGHDTNGVRDFTQPSLIILCFCFFFFLAQGDDGQTIQQRRRVRVAVVGAGVGGAERRGDEGPVSRQGVSVCSPVHRPRADWGLPSVRKDPRMFAARTLMRYANGVANATKTRASDDRMAQVLERLRELVIQALWLWGGRTADQQTREDEDPVQCGMYALFFFLSFSALRA